MLYDSVIIGGGPAGLSAAIYLGRFKRKVLVVSRAHGGRWDTHEINENYLGFPDGIATVELIERGRQQAEKFGAEFVEDSVVDIGKDFEFIVKGEKEEYKAKTVILATGVTDNFPQFKEFEKCLGKSLFWCITCDGFKTCDRKITIVGHSDEALVTAMQFLNFTPDIVFITNSKEHRMNPELIQKLAKYNIKFYDALIEEVESEEGLMKNIKLSNGEEVETEFMFSMQGAIPNTELAQKLGVKLDQKGYIISDNEQRTNVEGVYAAGDVTRSFAHQIVTAAHEGSMAGQAVNYDLYNSDQKE